PRSRPLAEACTSMTRCTATWLIIDRSVSGRSRATAPRYDAPPTANSPGVGVEEEMSCAPRPSGVPSSDATESTLVNGVCTTTGQFTLFCGLIHNDGATRVL